MTTYRAYVTETRCFEFDSDYDIDSDGLYEEAKSILETMDQNEVDVCHRNWDDIIKVPTKE